MMTYMETKQVVAYLLTNPPLFSLERLPNAFVDYERLIPSLTSNARALTLSSEESRDHNREYRNILLQIVSIEAAAGAAIERCRVWFRCLASLAAWMPQNAIQPINISESAAWTALAGQFEASIFAKWPDDPNTKATSSRVIYRLLTGKRIHFTSPRTLFENSLWEDICFAVENNQSEFASRTFKLIADWWLAEYQSSGTPVYDPENFSTFEPEPNAALVIALIRNQMPIDLQNAEHEKFYYVALMLAQTESNRSCEI